MAAGESAIESHWPTTHVFLMTTRPSLAGSLIMMIVALALGLASGLLISHMARTRWQTVDARENEAREPVDSGNAIPQ